jgi:F-type H+-transporting ATPase subunit b
MHRSRFPHLQGVAMSFSFIGAAHAAGADVANKGDGVFPPFDTSTFAGQLFWLALTFGVLYFLMSRIALPRVAETLEARDSRIDGDLRAAAAMQQKAKEAGEAYEKLLADARGNAQVIGNKAKDEANQAADQRRKVVEADSAQKIAQSEASIAAARDKAMTNVASIASDTAAEIVKRISGIAPKADDVKKAVAAAQASGG